MKINKIIDMLCNHDISKKEAVKMITDKMDLLKDKSQIYFTVDGVGESVVNSHAHLNLVLWYGYPEIEGKFKKGDTVGVVMLP